jgi:hypothetical protein
VWANGPYARTAYAAAGTGATTPAGQQTLPPPIPGGTASWLYEPNRSLSWALRGWAGRLSPSSYPGGGISIRPVPARGIMEVTAWWPDAEVLDLVRVDPDGALVPVRGGTPVKATGPTRRNYCQNPSFEAGLNGTVPDLGTPTLTRPNDGTAPRGSYYLKATIASAGSCGVVIPNSLGQGATITVGMDLRLSAAATSVTVQAAWVDGTGGALAAVSATLSTNEINRSISQFARQVVQIATPASGVTATVKVIAGGLPAGGVMSLDGVTIENGATDGTYFDGSTYGATWLGVTDLSASALAPLCVVNDGECPLDVAVKYKLVNPAITGGTMTSDVATLPSNNKVWMTHPATPDAPFEVFIQKRPLRGKTSGQGVFQAIDDPKFLTIAPRRRSGWRSTEDIALWTFGAESTELLWNYFDDNLPVLIRPPASMNWGTGTWISLGDLAEDPDGTADFQEIMKLTGPWVQVDAPVV